MRKLLSVVLMLIIIINLSACSFVGRKAGDLLNKFMETATPTEATVATTAPPATTVPVPDETKGTQFVKVEPYYFTVTNPDRVIFDAPSGNYVKAFDEVGVYTIVEEAVDADGVKWGRLKSGVGWVRFDNNVLPNLDMVFSSGAGAWGTQLEIYADGTFSGVYSDSDMGDNSGEYPNGTVYYSKFSGRFKDVTIVDRYTLSLTLNYINTSTPTGQTEYKDNMRYIYTDPYGMNDCEEFFLYLPGKDVSDLSESFRSWCRYALGDSGDTTDRYTLHNTANDNGFVEQIY